jgi:hypothetical protein
VQRRRDELAVVDRAAVVNVSLPSVPSSHIVRHAGIVQIRF